VWVLVVVLVLIALAGCCLWPFVFVVADSGFGGAYYEGVAVIHIDAIITGVSDTSLLGGYSVTPEYMIDLLQAADADPGVSAILLRIDSPGGTASASQEIAMEVARLEKPVVASIGDIGASGAYMIASQCDHIVATPSSAVGSIGSVIQIPNYEGLMEKLGIEYTILTSGEFKDTGSPYRSLTETETAMLRAELDMILDAFVADVAEGRGMSEDEVRELATGWVWTGQEALELGLVDSLGNYSDALDVAADEAGIEGDYEVIAYDVPSTLDLLAWFLGVSSDAGRIGDVLFGEATPVPVVR
jgi:protease-4